MKRSEFKHKSWGLMALIILCSCGFAIGQDFEGKIEFIQINKRDTLQWSYHIKGDDVRIESHDGEKVTGIYLVDLKAKKQFALNTANKLYMEMPTKPAPKGDPNAFEIKKTESTKTIHGYECSQWRVTNKAENTVVQYWVAGDNFKFFTGLMEVLNRKERTFTYFKQFDGIDGMFPFIAEERTTLRQEKSRLEVTGITAGKQDSKLFVIPKDYRLHKR